MVSKNVVLKELQPFRNNQRLIEHNQDATDIIQGMLKTHQKYFDEYDKISSFFFDTDIKKVCRDIWIFLKENVKYKIEPETKQTLRSPAGIIALGDSIGADCKSYSLFAAGILCSLQRKGQNINCCFRFASYKMFDKTPHHVFVVVNPNTKNEIWIDAVLDNFNEKKEYNYKTDKKLNMALYSMSGVGCNNNKVGFVDPATIATGLSLLTNLFGSNKPNPNDWKGWDALDSRLGYGKGAQATYWVLNNGDSPQNEAGNIISYMKAGGLPDMINRAKSDWNLTQDQFLQRLQNKLASNGFSEANNLFNESSNQNNNGLIPTTNGGNNNLFLYGGIALLAYLLFKK